MSILEDLISPLTLADFSKDYLYKNPYAAPFKAARFKSLINWILLDEIFRSGHNDCWLPAYGNLPMDPVLNTGRLNLEMAIQNFQQGQTVLIRHSEKSHPKLAAIAQDFNHLFNAPIDIQLYCTPASKEGFNWHYDAEDVFVIQSAGEKEFRLRKNTIHNRPSSAKLPNDLKFEKETTTQEVRCLLNAGDWLYIPAGWWHKAQAITDSYHLSVGVMILDQMKNFDSRCNLKL